MIQLEMFPELIDEKKEIENIKFHVDKTRKALFQELSKLRKELREVSQDHELIKMNLCKGRLPI